MSTMLTWFFILALIGVALAGAFLVLRSFITGESVGNGLFGPKPDKRLGVLEITPVDGKRRLVLVRRDNVEHLIMTGGPVDVVVETGINTAPVSRPRVTNGDGASDNIGFGRQARAFGPAQAAKD